MSPSPSVLPRSGRAASPLWIEDLEAAVWVVDSEGRLRQCNPCAQRLLRIDPEQIGAPCHEAIRGLDEDGKALCVAHCRLRSAVAAGRQVAPQLMRRVLDGSDQFLLVVPIPTATEGERADSSLLHIAVDVTRHWRSTAFLETIAGRGGKGTEIALETLTEREQQILTLLSEGECVKRIAFRLGLSHATGRNHVQHILEKLGAHSMLEAIALDLLRPETHEDPPETPSPST